MDALFCWVRSVIRRQEDRGVMYRVSLWFRNLRVSLCLFEAVTTDDDSLVNSLGAPVHCTAGCLSEMCHSNPMILAFQAPSTGFWIPLVPNMSIKPYFFWFLQLLGVCTVRKMECT